MRIIIDQPYTLWVSDISLRRSFSFTCVKKNSASKYILRFHYKYDRVRSLHVVSLPAFMAIASLSKLVNPTFRCICTVQLTIVYCIVLAAGYSLWRNGKSMLAPFSTNDSVLLLRDFSFTTVQEIVHGSIPTG